MSERDETPTVAELLAAYADDGLDGEQRLQVKAYLAEHPQAELELEALRQVLSASRAAQPRPTQEPAWDEMARAIRQQIDHSPGPGLWSRLRAMLRPRYPQYVAPVVVVISAAALFVVLRSGSGSQPPTAETMTPVAEHASASSLDFELRAPELIELADDELDSLYEELAPESILPSSDYEDEDEDEDDDQLGAPAILSDEIVAEWTEDDDTSAPRGADGDLGLFDEPDYSDFVDSLNDDELNQLEAYLAEQTG